MDPLDQIKHLAGLGSQANKNGAMSPVGSNTSLSAADKRRIEREKNIKPGTDAWFKLWFARPELTGEKHIDLPPSE